uniref:Drug/Metabolite Transporter (DMT) Superfamily putat n=1 Tax=Albugo laibachii Nc14 TaxID=890382 RepID=F0WN50_9STRA|nr:Drug/Metabolite Transporter (DMT) Superfamily putat [Albugo laibachii Nc14]|eukprot:CCA22739.1 Drug/Metabolite Transporter (DMT) Superfamily putat [Albugo laibachii Nc14]
MLVARGFFLAFLNSIINALCDPLRKYLTNYLNPFAIVAKRGMIQAPVFFLWALYDCDFKLPRVNNIFWTSVCISGLINVATSYLYNRSIQISTISETVPYLSFTPGFLVILAFLVLGEIPSSFGVVGILFAAMGGMWLQGGCNAESMLVEKKAGESKGAIYMTLVAFLWSVTNVFDKIGVQNSTPVVYGAAIQVVVTTLSFILSRVLPAESLDHVIYAPLGERKPKTPWGMVILAGLTSVISYYVNLLATQQLEVSYVIAIKRSGCIWSALLGKFLFHESNFCRKMPSISLMFVGVVCIILSNNF